MRTQCDTSTVNNSLLGGVKYKKIRSQKWDNKSAIQIFMMQSFLITGKARIRYIFSTCPDRASEKILILIFQRSCGIKCSILFCNNLTCETVKEWLL